MKRRGFVQTAGLAAVAASLAGTSRAPAYGSTPTHGSEGDPAMDTTLDRLEILEVLNRHQIYIDLQVSEAYARLYAEDGSHESSFAAAQGRRELVAMSRRLQESGFTAGKRHFTGPAMIDVEGDRATALSYWWWPKLRRRQRSFATCGYRGDLPQKCRLNLPQACG